MALQFAGCFALPKRLENFQAVNFNQNGAVGLQVVTEGAQPGWYDSSEFVNLDTGEKFNSTGFDYGRVGELPPGRYSMNISQLSTFVAHYSYDPSDIGDAEIPLKMKTKPFFVRKGELVYLGELHFWVGEASGIPPAADPLMWIKAALKGQRNVQVTYKVENHEEKFKDILRGQATPAHYEFRTEIMEFEK